MAVSSRPENFFQTTSSIADIERKKRKAGNTQGNPIKLATKILALEAIPEADPSGDVVFVAEAGGTVSAVKLSTGEVSRVGKGSQAPLTSLTYFTSPATKQLEILAGGWDKSITQYSLSPTTNPTVTSQFNFKSHNDFVKCVAIVPTADRQPILVSGGADGEINFWNPQANYSRLATVQPQARGIETILIDPYSAPQAPVLFFSTSQREIFSITLPTLLELTSTTSISQTSTLLQSNLSSPLVFHETSVYALHFDNLTTDLWTASADKTCKKLLREQSWTPDPDISLLHPDFVRDITTHPSQPLVITACRDEDIRIWNSNTGALYHILTGHFEEVTGLAIVSISTPNTDSNTSTNSTQTNDVLVSISIDATIRTWNLNPKDLAAEIERSKNPVLQQDNPEPDNGINGQDLGLTEEEEAELRALMEEEESETLEKMVHDAQ